MAKQYFIGLIIILIVFATGYLLLTTTSAPVNPLGTLLVGLILGHAIGIVFAAKSKARNAIPSDAGEAQTLYVGNLPFKTTRYELRELFQPYGKIYSARIVIDKATRKPRGYGFVEMDKKGANKAIKSLHGSSLEGRNLKVTEANERN